MRLDFELSYRLLKGRGLAQMGLTGWISLVGLILGVACLVVSMAVVSGFEVTLQRSVSDVTGHLQILKTQGLAKSEPVLDQKLKEVGGDNILGRMPFLWVEAVAASQGQISGILLQGVDPASVDQVLGLRGRLQSGEFSFADRDGRSSVMIGKALAQKFGLKVGDTLRVVVPLMNELDPSQFRRKLGVFTVAGILDLGKFEFNERVVVGSLSAFQELADVGERSSGVLVKIFEPKDASPLGFRLSQALGAGYRVRDWSTMNENMLEAIRIERYVIFFVILIIVFAAAFNVASALYISVVQRYPEIGILKAMGLPASSVLRVFAGQGFLMGVAGCVGGFLLGLLLCGLFWVGQSFFLFLPGSVYKLDHIDIILRPQDLASIFVATLVICVAATWAPSRRGARLTAVEGLRYE